MSDIVRTWCAVCARHIADCAWNGNHPATSLAEASTQVADAILDLERHPDTYMRWPWPALDTLMGGMAPGQVHYVVGFSGIGKSTFIASAILRWIADGRRIVALPLEIKPNTFRTYVACQMLGVDPGPMISGDFWREPEPEARRETIRQAIQDQLKEPLVSRLSVLSVADVSVASLRRAAKIAQEREASVLVIDHVDHLEANAGRGQYESSVAVNREALRIAQEYDLLIIAMSQANQEALRGNQDRLAQYEPPRVNHVLNGGQKRHVATNMIGLFRPILQAPEGADTATLEAWKADMARARRGEIEPHKALEPMTMGVVCMKNRAYGSREGQRIKLAWRAGRIVDHETLPYSLRRVS